MADFIFCLNAILPSFLLIAIGYYVKSIGLVNSTGIAQFNKVLFYLLMPMITFENTYTSDLSHDFDMRVRELCDAWFGDGEMTDELYGFGMKFLYGGAFGTKEVNMRNVAASEISSVEGKSFLHKKIKYILRLIFPSPDVMKEEYPFLKRVPVLLPAAWIIRGFRSVFLKKGTVRNVLSNAARVSEDTAEKRS